MLIFCPLASGSKGNVLYLETKETKLLIDAGLSTKQIKLRLKEIGVSLEEIDAIIVTHEHRDHILGLKVLNQTLGIPIFSNKKTAEGIYENLGFMPTCKIFTTNESFSFQDLEITPFSVQHDTKDPVALKMRAGDQSIGICTDLGFVTTLVKKHLAFSDVLYIEANHEPHLVMESNRPDYYKRRVLGNLGHLSNSAAAELIDHLYHDKLQLVYLAHLSEECNCPVLAKNLVEQFLKERGKEVPSEIAHQHQVSYRFDQKSERITLRGLLPS